jgi:hypothetical protein
LQKGIEQRGRQAALRSGGHDAEQRTAGGNPGERLLQDPRAEVTVDQLADRECRERTILAEVGSKHRPAGPNTSIAERLLKPGGRQVDNGDRVANERQRRAHGLERRRFFRDRQVAGLPA